MGVKGLDRVSVYGGGMKKADAYEMAKRLKEGDAQENVVYKVVPEIPPDTNY